MTKSVIDLLEAVEIYKMHCDAATFQRKDSKHLLQFFDQSGAVRKAGQPIVQAHLHHVTAIDKIDQEKHRFDIRQLRPRIENRMQSLGADVVEE